MVGDLPPFRSDGRIVQAVIRFRRRTNCPKTSTKISKGPAGQAEVWRGLRSGRAGRIKNWELRIENSVFEFLIPNSQFLIPNSEFLHSCLSPRWSSSAEARPAFRPRPRSGSAGIEAVVLEQDAAIGGTWARRYDRLHLHTIRRYSGLAHFPIPDRYPTYLSRDELVQYLNEYAGHFGLKILTGTTVRKIRAEDAGPANGRSRRPAARHGGAASW